LAHAREERQLLVMVRAVHEKSQRTYRNSRVYAELRANEIHISRKRVARIMRNDGLRARIRKRYKCTTMSDHDQPVAANILDQRFDAERPSQRWVGDVTELLADSGKLYLAAILDLYSRMLVGWAVSAVNDRHLANKGARDRNQAALSGRGPFASHRPG
jgi:putative transposase